MKVNKNCSTCKYSCGSKCNKNKIDVGMYDCCSAYKIRKSDIVSRNMFVADDVEHFDSDCGV
jgi:hypothetical protein